MKGLAPILLIVVLLAGISSSLLAGLVGGNTARNAAGKWLSHNRKPMGRFISAKIKSSESLVDPNGLNLCHIFNLDQGGFVVMSSDDRVEPVIAFSENGTFHLSEDNPLVVMLRKDMGQRLKSTRKQTMKKSKGKLSKWQQLVESESSREPSRISSMSVNDVRVDSFLPTRWSQTEVYAGLCYNYYTPNNYPSGCVATVMAQLMRYHEWPKTGIGVNGFSVLVDGVSNNKNTMGGNGSGGAYNWSQMPYVPSNGVTDQERQAIGRLMHDAGVSVGMSYTSGGSSASTSNTDLQFVSTFNYSNSMYMDNFSENGDATLWTILNSNLNAKLPVILSIRRAGGGHAVVADGYGYNGGSQYHHINLGWDGYEDAWYSLPIIDTSNHTYTMLSACVYNVYPTGFGEIVSGQILSLSGYPVAGAVVKAYYGGSFVAETVSDNHGIYALVKLASSRQYNIKVTKDGYAFANSYVSVGQSTDIPFYSAACGNKWDVDFISTNASAPTAIDTVVVVDANGFTDIELTVSDDGLPAPSQLSFAVTSLPTHGTISDPCSSVVIDSVPYILANNANVVRYTSCPYFGGEDAIGFYADDGGEAPDGGVSNTATVSVDVNNRVYSEIEVDSDSYLYAMVMDTGSYYAAKMQVIYLADEIGGARNITALSLRFKPVPGMTMKDCTIRMQHTDKGYFAGLSSDYLATGWTTVHRSDLSITSEGWLKIDFDKPFKFNGSRNLMIDFTYNNSATSGPFGGYFFFDASTKRSVSLASRTEGNGDPLQWSDWYGKSSTSGSQVPSMKFDGITAVDPMPGDVDASCRVCLADFAGIAKAWGSHTGDVNYDYRCDLSTPKDERIDINDLVVVMDNWLEKYWD